MQEDGNGDATTNGGDGEGFTAAYWTVDKGQYRGGEKGGNVQAAATKSRRRPGRTMRMTTT